MIEMDVSLLVDGADKVPMLTLATEIVAHLSGASLEVRDEAGGIAYVVIDDAKVGDFREYVPDEGESW